MRYLNVPKCSQLGDITGVIEGRLSPPVGQGENEPWAQRPAKTKSPERDTKTDQDFGFHSPETTVFKSKTTMTESKGWEFEGIFDEERLP